MAAANFKDLVVWQKTYEISLLTYEITKEFPKSELFGLVSQMRRAAVSVCSNIAEGFGRFGPKEKDQFYAIAKGSLTELECQYLIAKGIGYISEELSVKTLLQIDEAQRILAGLQKANKQNRRVKQIL
ncbi:MAG: four helix bundle protein [Candidatus Saccharimonadales bacterium]